MSKQENNFIPGFQRPQIPHDEWMVRQYEKYALGVAPSLEEIETTATCFPHMT